MSVIAILRQLAAIIDLKKHALLDGAVIARRSGDEGKVLGAHDFAGTFCQISYPPVTFASFPPGAGRNDVDCRMRGDWCCSRE
jgi:hypothetical protein